MWNDVILSVFLPLTHCNLRGNVDLQRHECFCYLLRSKSAIFVLNPVLVDNHHVIHPPRQFTYLCHLYDTIHSHWAMSATVTTTTTLVAPQDLVSRAPFNFDRVIYVTVCRELLPLLLNFNPTSKHHKILEFSSARLWKPGATRWSVPGEIFTYCTMACRTTSVSRRVLSVSQRIRCWISSVYRVLMRQMWWCNFNVSANIALAMLVTALPAEILE